MAVVLNTGPCTCSVRPQLLIPNLSCKQAGLLAEPLTRLVYSGSRSEVQRALSCGAHHRELWSVPRERNQGNMEDAGAELDETQEVTVMPEEPRTRWNCSGTELPDPDSVS